MAKSSRWRLVERILAVTLLALFSFWNNASLVGIGNIPEERNSSDDADLANMRPPHSNAKVVEIHTVESCVYHPLSVLTACAWFSRVCTVANGTIHCSIVLSIRAQRMLAPTFILNRGAQWRPESSGEGLNGSRLEKV